MPSVWRRKRRASDHITGVAVVPIRVPTPITTSTKSSIHFIEKPQKKAPLSGGTDFRDHMVFTASGCGSQGQ